MLIIAGCAVYAEQSRAEQGRAGQRLYSLWILWSLKSMESMQSVKTVYELHTPSEASRLLLYMPEQSRAEQSRPDQTGEKILGV